MKIRKQDSILIFILGILLCIFIAFFKEFILPEKYFFDSNTLQYGIEHPVRNRLDQSFSNTANLYRFFNIDRYFLSPLIALITYFVVVKKVFRNYDVESISFSRFFLIIIFCLMAMVYLSTYSKDLVLFIIVVVPFVFLEKKSLLIWSVFVILYAYFFRTYWFITIFLFWIVKLFLVKSPTKILIFIPFCYLALNIVYNSIFGMSIIEIRELANMDRDIDSGQTVISTFLQGNIALDSLNNIITLLFLIIPIPLLLLGKPFYILLTFLITSFFYNFLKFYFKESKIKKYENIFSFVISFMLVQSLFEPDYGSFVRHLSPLYPFVFLCIAKNTGLAKKNLPDVNSSSTTN